MYQPHAGQPGEVLPDVTIPVDDRVTRRGATPRLFISYSHANSSQVAALVQRLSREQYYDVWIDYDNIPGGSQWDAEIARGIEQADVVLFMMTPESCASPFCKTEIDRALARGKRIIPIRLNRKAPPEALAQVGLSDRYQFIDYTGVDDRTNWEMLLRDLPPVLDRDLLDPTKRGLHIDYLRSIFTQLGTANLSYLLDAAPRKQVNLIDVYVPLKLRVDFKVEVHETGIVDWWLRDVQGDGHQPERDMRPKSLLGFTPQGTGWTAWRVRLDEGWERFKRDHEARQADKKKPVRLGEYNWGRLESEDAPALMDHLVITGDPGSGKTTLMKHLALCMAGDMLRSLGERADATLDDLRFWPHPAYIPLFVELRALIGTAFSDANTPVTLEAVLNYIEQALWCSSLP